MKKNLLKKTFVICIVILLFSVNIATSNNVIKNNNVKNQYLESPDKSEDILIRGKNGYAFCSICPGISSGPVYFDLDDPGEITLLAPTASGDILTGGTWANGYGWIAIEYGTGVLWNIDPDTGEMTSLGGGGGGYTNDLAWDDLTWWLYYCFGYSIWGKDKIQLNTTVPIVSFAFNSEGICYGIDTITDSLHIINISTGEVTFVANLSINLDYYSNYISFDKDNDILYLLTDGLYIVNTETGECTLIGSTEGYELTAFAIPYSDYNPPPYTKISFDPSIPDGDNDWYISNVTAYLNATDEDGINATYYRINDGDWNTYASPFSIYEEGDNVLIEFYSVDDLGRAEDVKSKTLDIDKTPPELMINYTITKIGDKEWSLFVTYTFKDNTSRVGHLDIYINGTIQTSVPHPNSPYSWSFPIKGEGEVTFGAAIYDHAGHYVYKEILIKLSRNKNQLINNPLMFRFLENYNLLCKFFQLLGL